MRTAQGPFPMETTYTWRPDGGATRMTLRNRGEPTGFASLGAPTMTAAMRRESQGPRHVEATAGGAAVTESAMCSPRPTPPAVAHADPDSGCEHPRGSV